jgi:sulfhydrogenase subunit beta (sulfur reductase)
MGAKIVTRMELDAWVTSLVKSYRVIGPQAKDDKFQFEDLYDAKSLRLDYDVTLLPPKQFFLPPREVLLTFQEKGITNNLKSEPFILFGVHPYDCEAIAQLDRLFEMKNPDIHYLTRRENAFIIALDVITPSENVFAGYLGYAHTEKGCDALITQVGKDFLVDAKTPKGEKLLGACAAGKDADNKAFEARKGVWEANSKALRKHLLKAGTDEITKKLGGALDHPVWKEKAELCFSCGSCNLVCPTCYCFDIQDDLGWDLASGKRERTWDGCMLESFATVSGAHNFRNKREDRYRHRYLRKGKYVPEKIGSFACVGCGRCIGACVARIANPVEVFNAIMEG